MSFITPDQFNAASYFIDRHLEEGRGEKIAIEGDGFRITYRDLFLNVNRTGNALRDLGLRMEDRVALILLDCPEFAYSFFGAVKIGAVPVPMNTSLGEHDYKHLLNDSRARIVVVSESLLARLQAIPKGDLPYLEHVVVVHGVPHESPSPTSSAHSFHDITSHATSDLKPAPTGKDDVAFWLYSSGSTGVPKACVHLQHDMVVCSERYARGILKMTEDDRCFSVSKLFFAYGLGNGLYYPLAVGATSILLAAKSRPDVVLDLMQKYRPTLFFSVPINYALLIAYNPSRTDPQIFSSVRHCVSAGEVLPAAIARHFQERFGQEILDGIGSTEALQAFISNRPNEVRLGSSGQVIPGYEVKILDDAGMPVSRGTVGNLFVKSDATCAYYFNQHEKTKDAINGHWLKTGDRYYEDEDGYFWHQGRSDDMMRSNGMWVSPAEVEEVLMTHPAVHEVAVVGREDERGLMHPTASVVLRPEIVASPELMTELKQFAESRLPAHKQPRQIEFLSELPRTATGKIQRFKLRARGSL